MSREIEFSANVRRVNKMLGPSTAASTSAELEESMAVSSKRSFGEFTARFQKELDSLFTPFQIYRIRLETGNKVGNAREPASRAADEGQRRIEIFRAFATSP